MKGITRVLLIICGVATCISGLYCMFYPGQTYSMVGYCVGVSMILDAVGNFSLWWELRKAGADELMILFGAILSAVFGFFVINNEVLQAGIDLYIIYYLAIWMIIRGCMYISFAHKLHKFHKEWNTQQIATKWYLPLILGILMIVSGVVSIANPGAMGSTLGFFIGFGAFSAGGSMVALAFIAPAAE